ncbi:MAG: hypothetical protein IPJ87_14870 [Flavobacteriales bacterium]|nr:hypothetical protein [Flavobacteriales bacterium]MBK7943132.1 hypothetical protein [Flavobacteriales bacterium]MBK8947368.1 hypothetical protein [Flavobacteriales bacterium]MBK9701815.1 hypothetical protein [Flavobacteriales bacterium]
MRTRALFLPFCALLMVGAANAQGKKADKDTEQWRYELEAVNTGGQGTYQVKVWSYSKNATVATEQAKKNAVHGVVFRGFPGKDRVPGQNPLCGPNLEQEHADFFREFFKDGGKYMKFVQVTNGGMVAEGDRLKVGKEYKIGVIVSVDAANLRKDLEAAGICKGLGSGF